MFYKLRWYFDYFTKAPYFGVWGYADPTRPAWKHSTEGLANAIIQGKSPDGKIVNLAECSGQDFQNFQWLATARANPMQIKKGFKLRSNLVGLMIQHRNGQIQVYTDGSVKNNNITYENIHFATYGR